MRGINIIVLGSALALCVAAAPIARADVEGDVRSGDKVLGTILPGSETERWTIACPEGSKLKVTLKGPKKKSGGAVSFRVYDPSLDEIQGLGIVPKKTGAKLSRYDVPASGEYTVEVFASDGETGGEYKLKIVCALPRKVKFEGVLDGSEQSFGFYTVIGTQVKAKLKPSAGSAAGPVLVRIAGPGAYEELINVGPPKAVASPKIALQRTGDFDLFYDGDGGAVAGTLTFKAKKSVSRTIDVRSDAIDPGGEGGEQAVVGVIGPGGAVIVAPGDGSNPADIGGAGVDIPAGALEGPVAIVIATAPPIGPQEDDQDPVGNTTFFGPEGLQFTEDATLTLPFNPDLVVDADDVRVYTRDADGNVVLIDPTLYDVNLQAGTVSVPTAHFSSWRVFNERDPLQVENVIQQIPSTPTDVVAYFLNGGQSVSQSSEVKLGTATPFGEEFLVAHGEVIDHVFVDHFVEPPQTFVNRVAGGGVQAQPGGFAADFDFPGPITALATDGFAVFASTATQVFVLFPDFEGGFNINLFAGTGATGDSGDGGEPIAATFTNIADLLVPSQRSGEEVLVLDRGATRVRHIKVDFQFESIVINTVLGTGTAGVGPDGVPAVTSPLLDPTAMAIGPEFGELFVADGGRIRLVQVLEEDEGILTLHDGVGIQNHTFAGPVDGATGPGVEGVARLSAGFTDIAGMVFDFQRFRLLVTDRATHTVQEIPAAPGGIVRSLIGTRGTPATSTTPVDFTAPGSLLSPGACLVFFGNLLFLEEGTFSLRCVTIGPGSEGPFVDVE